MNLFNRIILQSGSALSSWAMAGDPIKTTNQLAESVNCPLNTLDDKTLDTATLVSCLRELTYSQLLDAEVTEVKVNNHQLLTYGTSCLLEIFLHAGLLFGLQNWYCSIYSL